MFKKTRLTLAAWYALSLCLVSLVFSVAMYRVLAIEIDRLSINQRIRIERRMLKSDLVFIDPEIVAELKQRLAVILIVINAGLLVFSGSLGYFLAGKTLSPIKTMVDEQNRFISDASHELKTPLTSLKTAFEVYLRDKKRQRGEADAIIKESLAEVDRLQVLSEHLLDLSSYQHVPKAAFEPISVSTLIETAVQKMAKPALIKTIHITVKHTPGLHILGNPDSLIQLLVILIDNAIKYSPVDATLTISSAKVESNVVIRVIDHGIGIGPKEIPHIFDRFYRADSSRSSEVNGKGGYGLGLAIAKRIIESHQGSITVKSKAKIGSTFTLTLPYIAV